MTLVTLITGLHIQKAFVDSNNYSVHKVTDMVVITIFYSYWYVRHIVGGDINTHIIGEILGNMMCFISCVIFLITTSVFIFLFMF